MGIRQIENLAEKRDHKRLEVKQFLGYLNRVSSSTYLDWDIGEMRLELEGLIDKLSRDTINISIVSEVSSGKSTFLNALIFGEPILESRLGETTAKIFEIKYGKEFSINGKIQPSLLQLKEEIHKENQDALQKIKQHQIPKDKLSVITLPNVHLQKGIELYDTPGFATINEKSMLNIIKKAIVQSDATILLLDISQGIKESERLFIKTILHKINPNKRFIVLNKYDSIFGEDDLLLKPKDEIEDEIQEVIGSVTSTLRRLQKDKEDPIVTYHLSAKKALVAKMTKNQDKLTESRFEYFEDSFWKNIVIAKDQLFDDHVDLFIDLVGETEEALKSEKKRLLKKRAKIKNELYELNIQERNITKVTDSLTALATLNNITLSDIESMLKSSQEEYVKDMVMLLNMNLESKIYYISWWQKLFFWQLKDHYHFSIKMVINQAQSYLVDQIKTFVKEGLKMQDEQQKRELILRVNHYLKIDFGSKEYPAFDTEAIITHTLYRIKHALPWDYPIFVALLKNPKGNQELLYPNYSELNQSIDILRQKISSYLVQNKQEIEEYISDAYQKIDLLEKKFEQKISLNQEIESISQLIDEIDSVLSSM